jgi:hypothetical protein
MMFNRRSHTRVPRHLQALAARVAREQRSWAHRQNARGVAVVIKPPSVQALQSIHTEADVFATAVAWTRPIVG